MRRTVFILTGLLVLLAAMPASAIDWDKVVINGYTSFEFEKMLAPKGEGAGDPNGSFDADGLDLVLNVHASDKVRAAMDLAWEHGPASEDNRGNVAIEYAFVEYTFSDLAKIRFGKMLTPFGVYNQIHTAKPAFLSVKEPSSTNTVTRLSKDAERFYPRFGSGIALQGDGGWGQQQYDYDVMISNGEQTDTNPYEEDNNATKAIAARFRWDPIDGLRFGASAYRDDSSDDLHIAKVRSQGVEFEWNAKKFHLLGEAVFGKLEYHDRGAATGAKNQVGWFIQPAYHFSNGVTPYVRFDWLDPNTSVSADQAYDLVVGVNWEPSRWFMIKLENNYFKGASNSTFAKYPGADYNEIKAAVVLGF